MHWKGHVGAALLAYAPLGTWLALGGSESLAIAGAAVMVALAPVPDWDEEVPFVAHRGFTHTVLFAVVVGAIVGGGGYVLAESAVLSLGSPDTLGAFGFLLGAASILVHVAVDALTPMGVRPLWPVSGWHVSLSITLSKSPIANYALLAAGVLASFAGWFVATG